MARQLKLNIYKGSHGGRRPGSGRKRIHSPGVAHRPREKVTGRIPLHINFKFNIFIRNQQGLRILSRAIENARRKGLRILEYSLLSNHVHLIVEADSNAILKSSMMSLLMTFTKMKDRGSIQTERYHLHVLKTPQEVKNALIFVRENFKRHTGREIDPFYGLIALDRPQSFLVRSAGNSTRP